MADYIVHGKKGNGKSLVLVGRIRDALMAGKPVATNLDLNLDKLLPVWVRDVRCFRLPDRPTIDDLLAIGFGSLDVDESSYGMVVLDECAMMLNSRTFNDQGRKSMLDWFVHSRKLGWDTYFICQNPVQIDKQVRESLVEFSVSCKRMDKVRVPFIGVISKNLLGHEIRPPKLHVATVRYGLANDAMISDRWMYTGTDLYDAYDTRQVFKDSYEHGIFSLLGPWHLSAKIGPPGGSFCGPLRPGVVDYVLVSERGTKNKRWITMTKYLMVCLLVGLALGAGAMRYFYRPAPGVGVVSAPGSPGVPLPGAVDKRHFSESLSARGYFLRDGVYIVLLSDGRTISAPKSFIFGSSGYEVEISPDLWIRGGVQ